MSSAIEALREAIRLYNRSQAALARAIGVDRRTVSDWLNGHRRPSYPNAIKIELVTGGRVKREDLVPHVRFARNKYTNLSRKLRTEIIAEGKKEFTLSEKMTDAETLKNEMGERRGRPSKGKVQNFAPFSKGKKSRELLAKEAGFKNGETYRQAKKLFEQGIPELICAVSEGRLAVSTASILAQKLSHEEQQQILLLSKKEMIAKAKQLKQINAIKSKTNICLEGNNL